jgi:hypothetical protein
LFGTPAALTGVGFAACPDVAGARFAGAAVGFAGTVVGFAGTVVGFAGDGVAWDTALAGNGVLLVTGLFDLAGIGVVLLVTGLFDFAGIGAGLTG